MAGTVQPARPDRIGDPCWYLRYVLDESKSWRDWEPGFLRAWFAGTDDMGTAIIERHNGRCESVEVSNIRFCTSKPETPKESNNDN